MTQHSAVHEQLVCNSSCIQHKSTLAQLLCSCDSVGAELSGIAVVCWRLWRQRRRRNRRRRRGGDDISRGYEHGDDLKPGRMGYGLLLSMDSSRCLNLCKQTRPIGRAPRRERKSRSISTPQYGEEIERHAHEKQFSAEQSGTKGTRAHALHNG